MYHKFVEFDDLAVFVGVLHRVGLKFVHFEDLLRAIHGRGDKKFEKRDRGKCKGIYERGEGKRTILNSKNFIFVVIKAKP